MSLPPTATYKLLKHFEYEPIDGKTDLLSYKYGNYQL